ncbi:hypothetical protein GBA52_011385 [Prunus armeniaca]|nr:hypothetical protein GBA52_011385 [Prunus armeniaca]
MTDESGRVPLKTEPKPPPPNFSEKFFVASCRSLYPKATNEPSTAFPFPVTLFLCLKITTTISPKRIAIPAAEPATTPTINPLLLLGLLNSEAASLRYKVIP